MALRWTSAAMLEEVKGFGRLKPASNSPHCERPWQVTKPIMPSTGPLNRLPRSRNLLDRHSLPGKLQTKAGTTPDHARPPHTETCGLNLSTGPDTYAIFTIVCNGLAPAACSGP